MDTLLDITKQLSKQRKKKKLTKKNPLAKKTTKRKKNYVEPDWIKGYNKE